MASTKRRPRRLQLAKDLDGTQIGPLLDQLAKKRGNPLTINASKVERLGAQCAQVLIAAAQTWRSEMQTLQIAQPSNDFVEGLEILGLSLEHVSFEGGEL